MYDLLTGFYSKILKLEISTNNLLSKHTRRLGRYAKGPCIHNKTICDATLGGISIISNCQTTEKKACTFVRKISARISRFQSFVNNSSEYSQLITNHKGSALAMVSLWTQKKRNEAFAGPGQRCQIYFLSYSSQKENDTGVS